MQEGPRSEPGDGWHEGHAGDAWDASCWRRHVGRPPGSCRSREARHRGCSGRRAPGTILGAGGGDTEVRRTQPGVRQRSGRWLGGAPVRGLRRQACRAGRPVARALFARSRECARRVSVGAATEGRHARRECPAPSRPVGHPVRSNRQPGDESERDAHVAATRPAERRGHGEDGHRRSGGESRGQPVPDRRRSSALGGRRDLRARRGGRPRRHGGLDHRGRAPRTDVSRQRDVHLPAARREDPHADGARGGGERRRRLAPGNVRDGGARDGGPARCERPARGGAAHRDEGPRLREPGRRPVRAPGGSGGTPGRLARRDRRGLEAGRRGRGLGDVPARLGVEPRRGDSGTHAPDGHGPEHGRHADARQGRGAPAMIEKLIAWSIRRRELVALGAIFVLVAGVFLLRTMPVDAIPDLSDTQVIVYTDYPGQAPQVVEDQVTYPLLTTFLAVPKVKVVRGQSMFSSSFVYVIFQDGTDLYWARSRVLEYLNAIQSRLPAGAKTRLGPDATGVGWVYQYALEGPGFSPDRLRSIQDFQVRYALQSVAGVAEVASLGGFVRQYKVLLDPARLLGYGVAAREVIAAVRGANQDVGARTVEVAGSDYAIRGLGYFRGVGDIGKVAVGVGKDGRPVRVGDVARVTIGPDLRLGIAERDGRGEAVGGVVVMRYGENALRVIDGVKQRIAEIAPALPAGVRIVPTYDRSDLIHGSIKTLWRTLLEESLIVALVCAVFLLHARSALVAIATLPLGILVSLAVTRWLGINGNIMSLGGLAIAIGAMIDAAIVMLENLHKHIEHEPDPKGLPDGRRPHWERVFAAAREVGPALFMSLLIITLSFLPVFTLEDQEGRLFRPLALTKTFAMAAAALLSVTLVPALMGWFVKGKIRAEAENPVNRLAIQLYRPVLQWALRARWLMLGGAAAILALTLIPLSRLGSEFMPPLNEGSLMYMPNTLPAVSLTTQRRLLHVEDSILMTFPEVESVWGKAGRANTATDWAPMSMVETVVNLKPASEWRAGMTQDRLIAEMDRRLRLTGVVNTWTMPIKNRTDMLSTGVRTTLAVKIFGPDLATIQRIGQDIERTLATLRGTASVYAERSFGGRYLDIRPDADALARYGLTTGDVQQVISLALGGEEVTTTVEGRERYPVAVRYAPDFRDDPDKIARLLVGNPDGPQVPLGQVATFSFSPGAAMIRSEGGYLYDQVSIDVGGRDVGGYVRDAQARVSQAVHLPHGYWLRWSGQYEALERVKARLRVVVPLILAIIALLLYLTFGTVAETAIVMLSLPFALVGGVWIMWLLGYNLSIAAAVGFIALAGVAAETGVVMLVYLDHAWQDAAKARPRPTLGELVAAIEHGAVNRVRPKLMTVLAIMLGLVPAMWSHGAGASVMKRIAAPMVGGMVTSTILTLIVIPLIYYLWRRRGLNG